MAESDILFTKGFLKQERVGLETGVGDMTTEIGIGATIVSTWEDITTDIDNEILDRVTLINDQKRIIAAAMTSMYNSSTCGIASGTASFNTSGLTDILAYGDNYTVEIVGDTRGSNAVNVARAPLYADQAREWEWPRIESTTNTEVPMNEGAKYKNMTPGNANVGAGLSSVLFENGTYSGSAGKTNSLFRNFTSVQIGWIYTRVGVVTVPDDEGGTETISYSNSGSACANALPANIASNIATINTLRTGIGTLSSPVTTIKAEKGFKQMAQHGMRNSKVIVTNRIVGIASAVGIISAYGS